jgi:MFS transporter, DHA1 family, multidrug resistance protein
VSTSAAPTIGVTATRPSNRGPWLIVLLSVLLGFASISTDFYLPALPQMGESLGASQGMLELTVSGYLLGFSLGQLFWGPVSDRFGRKVPLMIGIAVFIVGAAGCALATDATQLIGWRVLQALGASAAVVLGRAMVRDLFEQDEAARMISTLMMIMGVAPMVGPIAGAQILALSSWHMIFWTLTLIGLCTLLGVTRVGESFPASYRANASLGQAFREYPHHFRNRRLMAYVGALGCFGAGVFAYVSGSSFVFIDVFSLTPSQYGLAFATGIVGIVLANALNRRLVLRWGSQTMMIWGTAIGAAAGFATLLVSATGFGGLPAIATTLFIYIAMNGFIGANAIAGGLGSVERGTGSASALLGFAQYGGGMIGSTLVGTFSNGTPMPMAFVIAGGAGGACFCAVFLSRAQQTS